MESHPYIIPELKVASLSMAAMAVAAIVRSNTTIQTGHGP
jgi:hypothetical protein